jgi:hypothetical protein
MTDTSIKANEREADRLFERGVAAARGGQRRVAAGLLARAVQMNPRHEAGWLWLSGMLDSPKEIAFCLRSALAINPENQRAKQGLAWLEHHGKLNGTAEKPHNPANGSLEISSAPVGSVAAEPTQANWLQRAGDGIRAGRPASAEAVIAHELHARTHGESWWVNFRRTSRDMGRARLFLWCVPIVLLALTLLMNLSLRDAVERNEQLAREAAIAAARPFVPEAEPAPERAPEVLLSALPASDDASALAYLSAIEVPRQRLRNSIEEFRAVTNRPGGSSTTHVAAATKLRGQIEQAYGAIEGLKPPPTLAQAHAYYLSGLETELAALDDLLAFYSSFSTETANSATIRMSEANRYLERARAAFELRRQQISQPTFSTHAIR